MMSDAAVLGWVRIRGSSKLPRSWEATLWGLQLFRATDWARRMLRRLHTFASNGNPSCCLTAVVLQQPSKPFSALVPGKGVPFVSGTKCCAVCEAIELSAGMGRPLAVMVTKTGRGQPFSRLPWRSRRGSGGARQSTVPDNCVFPLSSNHWHVVLWPLQNGDRGHTAELARLRPRSQFE